MRTHYQQFVSRKGIAALALCTVASDWLVLKPVFLDRLNTIAVA